MGSALNTLSEAYIELSDDGHITIGTLSSIAEKFNDVSGIDTYIRQLSQAGLTANDVQGILAKLTTEKIRTQIETGNLRNATEDEIAQILREANVADAARVAHNLLAEAKARTEVQTRVANGTIDEMIANLDSEAQQLGITKLALLDLIIQENVFNKYFNKIKNY